MDFTKKYAARILNYSALAAAGLLVDPASAGTVFSTSTGFTPVTVTPGQTYVQASFGSPYGSLFSFSAMRYGYGSAASFVLNPGANAGGVNLGFAVTGNDPYRFGPGAVISPSMAWYGGVDSGTLNDIAGMSAGMWNGTGDQRGFLAIRFDPGDGFRYGFFDIGYDNNPSSSNGTLTVYGWAYESNAGQSITTETIAGSAVPEPATVLPMGLGLLALGAAGIRAKRSRENAA